MEFEAKLYLELQSYINLDNFFYFGKYPFFVVFGNPYQLKQLKEKEESKIKKYYLEINSKNKLLEYYNLENTNARIERGAVIRSGVVLSDTAIILMGAVVNTKVSIGDYTMIDMNAVVGSGAIIGNNCHIGAGAVIAGVMEPISNNPVIIEDNVLIGANATILNGVKIGKGSIVGAGSVVREDVDENTTVAGVPAKVVNVNGKWEINNDLR
jgi:2,3,4,5-tetrahydropyridine-2,6-dicarboxylate N-acetyltransferase